MNITTENQAIIFFLCILCGTIISLIFDLFRIHRTFFKLSKLALALADALFWVIASFTCLHFIIMFNSGTLRLFQFTGFFIGALLYFTYLSKSFRKITTFLLALLNKTAIFILKVILLPLALFYKLLRKPFFAVLYGIKSSSKRLSRFAKKI